MRLVSMPVVDNIAKECVTDTSTPAVDGVKGVFTTRDALVHPFDAVAAIAFTAGEASVPPADVVPNGCRHS